MLYVPLTSLCYIVDGGVLLVGHEPQHAEDEEPSEDTCTTVSQGKYHRVSERRWQNLS